MGRLTGKTAYITGGASGIGRSAAQLFAREGARLCVLDLSEDAGNVLVADIRRNGGDAVFAVADITSEDSVTAAFEKGHGAVGSTDILLNCAGGSSVRDGSIVDAPIEELWRVMQLDVLGTILACRAVIPAMVEKGGGSIVNMSSSVTMASVPGIDFYTAAKGAVSSLTRTLAAQHAASRIRVNALAPGVTMTERVLQISGGDVSRFPLSQKQRLGPALPEQVAAAALFLASDDAAMVTGVILPVDGGASSW
ncbi:SDR family oxidoreductase [Aquamicrobium sp. LC103]|uniref:SDR family NAD(P)-dependent oxidoreductase n=1 Tax=Aquamicrobium sp. LC103 TaxID=1120658 RepID=UPI00063E8A03|nr:SDR family oxidoreductase [Aquamicrobium sp. LC103]